MAGATHHGQSMTIETGARALQVRDLSPAATMESSRQRQGDPMRLGLCVLGAMVALSMLGCTANKATDASVGNPPAKANETAATAPSTPATLPPPSPPVPPVDIVASEDQIAVIESPDKTIADLNASIENLDKVVSKAAATEAWHKKFDKAAKRVIDAADVHATSIGMSGTNDAASAEMRASTMEIRKAVRQLQTAFDRGSVKGIKAAQKRLTKATKRYNAAVEAHNAAATP